MDNCVFKYNRKKELIEFKELDEDKNISDYYYFKNNILIIYNRKAKTKQLIKYLDDSVMLHKEESRKNIITIAKRLPKKNVKKNKIKKEKTTVEYRFPDYYHKEKPLYSDALKELNNIAIILPPQKEKEIIIQDGFIKQFRVNKQRIKDWMKCLNIEETKPNNAFIYF